MSKWNLRPENWQEVICGISDAQDLYLWGASGTGKTSLAKDALSELEVPSFYCNCVLNYEFRMIVDQLKENYMQDFLGIDTGRHKDLMKLTIELQRAKNKTNKYYIILDKVDRLFRDDVLSIHRLCELRELSDANLHFILISEVFVDEIFIDPEAIDRPFNPLQVFFRNYTLDQIFAILREYFPDGKDSDYFAFSNIVASIFQPYTSRLYHYKYAFSHSYNKFLDSLAQKGVEVAKTETLREIEYLQNKIFQKIQKPQTADFGMSLNEMLLSIAAFVCSKNPPKTDKAMLKAARLTKKRRSTQKAQESNEVVKFSLQRLLAAYSVLYHYYYNARTNQVFPLNLFSEEFSGKVQMLVSKGIIKVWRNKEELCKDKLVFVAEEHWVSKLAKSINIKLQEICITNVE